MAKLNQGKIAHLLLAAGASTRMGRPKQLLVWQGESLINHAIHEILQAGVAGKVIVVLGANPDPIRAALIHQQVEVAINPDWEQGMGSSIRSGLSHLQTAGTEWAGVCISLVDQPLVLARHYRALFDQWSGNQKAIVAAQYNGTLGVPAIFAQSFYPALLQLDGQAGARKILARAQGQVQPFALPEAAFDLDTPEDYRKLRDRH